MLNKARGRWFCSPCKKTSFGSQSRAEETIAHFQGTGEYVPVRAYPCPYNNGWHVTSKEVHDGHAA